MTTDAGHFAGTILTKGGYTLAMSVGGINRTFSSNSGNILCGNFTDVVLGQGDSITGIRTFGSTEQRIKGDANG
jgi:hypothetical protein